MKYLVTYAWVFLGIANIMIMEQPNVAILFGLAAVALAINNSNEK